MVADEMKEPVGPEFKKTFDQQNYGLPLRDALIQLTERVPLLDVRFFVTAVLIQRETGGNLAEILDNLAHVVRERFKILPPGARAHGARPLHRARCCWRCRRSWRSRSRSSTPSTWSCCFTEPHGPDDAHGLRSSCRRSGTSGSAKSSRSRCDVVILLPLLAFVFASLLVAAAAMALAPSGVSAIERRLGEVTGGAGQDRRVGGRRLRQGASVDGFKRLGAVAPTPAVRDGQAAAAADRRPATASNEALVVFFGIRARRGVRCVRCCFATPILVQPNLLLALGGCVLGYVLPGMVLARMAKKRQHRSGSGCPTRSTCSSSASRPASASTRRFSASARSWRSRIRTSATSCG